VRESVCVKYQIKNLTVNGSLVDINEGMGKAELFAKTLSHISSNKK